jgi:hypothetical protein
MIGSATPVILSMLFHDTVGQNSIDITEVNRSHGYPRGMSSVRINPVQEKWLYPPWQTETIHTFMVKDGEENEGILLANLLQRSSTTFSCVSISSFFAFKEGMHDIQTSVLRGSPTVSEGLRPRILWT